MGQQEIRISDILTGKVKSVSIAAGTHTLVLRRRRAELIEFSDALFRFNSGVLLPSATVADKKGEMHGGLELVAACLAYLRAHPTKKLFITGHTDTVGSNDSNVALSEIRGQAVHGLLFGNRDEFAKACYGPHLTDDKRYPNGGDGSKAGVLWSDYSDVLNWLATHCGFSCQCGFPKGPPWIYDATLKFQKAYNASPYRPSSQPEIKASGKFDIATWGAVFDCYDAKLPEYLKITKSDVDGIRGKAQFVTASRPYSACGEFKTIDQIGRDNYNSQTNRRVEVMFFDPGEEPQAPCLQGSCDAVTCDAFDGAAFRRHHLPPALTIRPWVATWDHPTTTVGIGQKRRMILEANDLPDGEVVEFKVVQLTPQRVEIAPPITAMVAGGKAVAEFGAWFARDRVASKVQLKSGEAFPEVTFMFIASAGGDSKDSSPLTYSDAVDLQFLYQDGHDTPVDTADFTLFSPWGTLKGKTTDKGIVQVSGLPPGGARVLLANSSVLTRDIP